MKETVLVVYGCPKVFCQKPSRVIIKIEMVYFFLFSVTSLPDYCGAVAYSYDNFATYQYVCIDQGLWLQKTDLLFHDTFSFIICVIISW